MEQTATPMTTCITQSMMKCFYPAYETMKQQYHRLRRTSYLEFNKQDFNNMCQVLQSDIVYCMDKIEDSCGQTTRQSALKQLNSTFHYFCYNGWKDYQSFQKCFQTNKQNVQEKIKQCFTSSELNKRNFFEHEYEYMNRDFFLNSRRHQRFNTGDSYRRDQDYVYQSDQASDHAHAESDSGTKDAPSGSAKTESVTSALKRDSRWRMNNNNNNNNDDNDDNNDVNMHEWMRNFGNDFDKKYNYNQDNKYWAKKYDRNNHRYNPYDNNNNQRYDSNRHRYDNNHYGNDRNNYGKIFNRDDWQKDIAQIFKNDYYNQDFERLNRNTREEHDGKQPQPEADKVNPDTYNTYEQDKDSSNNRNTPFFNNNNYRNKHYNRNDMNDKDYNYDSRNYGYNYYGSGERRPDYWAFYNYDIQYRSNICRGMSKMRDCSHEMKSVCNKESDTFMYNLNNMIYQFGRLFMNCDMAAESQVPSPEAEDFDDRRLSTCDHHRALSCVQPFQNWFRSFKDNEFEIFSDQDALKSMCSTMQQNIFPCITKETSACKEMFKYPFETLVKSFTHLCKPEIMEDMTNHHECWDSYSANVTYRLCKEIMLSKMEYYYDRHKGEAKRYICGLMSEFQSCVSMIDCQDDAKDFVGRVLEETMQPTRSFYQCNESRNQESGYMKSISWYDYLPPEMALNFRNKFN
ncbi:hypothetical protein Ahia01_000800400 [Argonauta hians]